MTDYMKKPKILTKSRTQNTRLIYKNQLYFSTLAIVIQKFQKNTHTHTHTEKYLDINPTKYVQGIYPENHKH